MSNATQQIVNKAWSFAHVLRGVEGARHARRTRGRQVRGSV